MDLKRICQESSWSMTWLKLYLTAQRCLHGLFPTTAASCSLYSAAPPRVWLPICWSPLIDCWGMVPTPIQSPFIKISSPGMCTGNGMVGDVLCLPLLLTKAIHLCSPRSLCSFISMQVLLCLWPEFWFLGSPVFWHCLLSDALMCD